MFPPDTRRLAALNFPRVSEEVQTASSSFARTNESRTDPGRISDRKKKKKVGEHVLIVGMEKKKDK